MTSYNAVLPVITCYYIIWSEKDYSCEISKNFWEFDWIRAHHLITSYYALLPVITLLLPVITCYYIIWREKDYLAKFLRISENLIGYAASFYDLLLRVITRYYLLLHNMERKRLLGDLSKNIWEFDWVRAHHLITRYYPLLRVITCYYIIWSEKDYSVKFLRISGNLIGYARIIL